MKQHKLLLHGILFILSAYVSAAVDRDHWRAEATDATASADMRGEFIDSLRDYDAIYTADGSCAELAKANSRAKQGDLIWATGDHVASGVDELKAPLQIPGPVVLFRNDSLVTMNGIEVFPRPGRNAKLVELD